MENPSRYLVSVDGLESTGLQVICHKENSYKNIIDFLLADSKYYEITTEV